MCALRRKGSNRSRSRAKSRGAICRVFFLANSSHIRLRIACHRESPRYLPQRSWLKVLVESSRITEDATLPYIRNFLWSRIKSIIRNQKLGDFERAGVPGSVRTMKDWCEKNVELMVLPSLLPTTEYANVAPRLLPLRRISIFTGFDMTPGVPWGFSLDVYT